MCKLFQVSIFFLLTLIVGQTTVSASTVWGDESNWGDYTRKDELTGKNSPPFLMYKVSIPGTTKGKLELQVVCSKQSGYDMHPHLVSLNTNLKPDDDVRVINHVLTVFESEKIQTSWNVLSKTFSVLFRQLNFDEEPPVSWTVDLYHLNSKFNNVYHSGAHSWNINPNYTNLPKKQEVIFESGKRMNIEFGQMYLNYVKSCFAGRQCVRVEYRNTVCGP